MNDFTKEIKFPDPKKKNILQKVWGSFSYWWDEHKYSGWGVGWYIRKFDYYYYAIRDFISPRQKWVMRGIPNGWCDKVGLMPQLIFNCIVHFVEDEKCFDTVDSGEPFSSQLKKYYNDIKVTLPALEKALKKAYDELPLLVVNGEFIQDDIPYSVRYKEVNDIEDQIFNRTSGICFWAITNRGIFWT